MNKIKNLFPKIYDFENLFGAYKDGIKQKRDRPDVMAYTEKLEENLINLQNEFIWLTYKVGRYRMFFVYEPKKRLIMALDFKDRVAQHAIYRQLNPLLDKQFIFDSYACRKDKGTHKAVQRLQYWFRQTERKPEQYYYLKLDISKYFYRIDHEILMDILREKIADKDLLFILEGQFCKHKLRLRYYIRYMDDVIILHHSKKHLERVKNEIADFLAKRLHLQLNNKTCIRPTYMGAEFVGFRVWSTHVKLRKKTAKKMVKRLQYVFTAYRMGEMDKESMERTVASYRGILQHFNSHGMAQKLNDIYRREVMEHDTN